MVPFQKISNPKKQPNCTLKFVRISVVLLFGFATFNLQANNQKTQETFLKPAGHATAYWAGFIPVYDATLRVSPATNTGNLLEDSTAVQLEICYRTSLSAENFIEAANQALPNSMPKNIQQAVKRLHHSYDDVRDTDCYQLSYTPETGTQLKLNKQLKFTDHTPGFKAVYFGIWLGEKPLSEKVKHQLTASLPNATESNKQ